MHARSPWEPPRLYSWTIVFPGEVDGSGAFGVTVDHDRALSAVTDALRDAPAGSRGLVHRVSLSFSRTGYFYEGLVARCRIDAESGTVMWDRLRPVGAWGEFAPRLTDPSEARGDAIPPEGIVAGLADLSEHEKRLRATTSTAVNSPAGGE